MRFQTWQSHHQHNDVVKDADWAVGLTECPAALQRWIFSEPEVERVINDFEKYRLRIVHTWLELHRPGVQKILLQDVTLLKSAIDEYGNPFLDTSTDILVIDTWDIVEKSVIVQYDNIHLFNTPHKSQNTNTSRLVSSLKNDRNLFSRLYVAYQFRDGNLNDCFSR